MIFAHPEILVDNKKVSQLLRNTTFKRKVQTIIVDEGPACCDRNKLNNKLTLMSLQPLL